MCRRCRIVIASGQSQSGKQPWPIRHTPPYRNVDHAPFIYFDVVPSFGVMHGTVQIELAARTLSPAGKDVDIEIVACGRLRCSPTAAQALRDAIDKSLKMLAQPQSLPTAGSATIQ